MAVPQPLRQSRPKLPQNLPGDVVQVALNAILGSMKEKQLIKALDTLELAIMCRAPGAVSPETPNVVGIRSRVDAPAVAAWYQQAGREAGQLATIAAQLRDKVEIKARKRERRSA